jgi:hypothetical protein
MRCPREIGRARSGLRLLLQLLDQLALRVESAITQVTAAPTGLKEVLDLI